MDLEVIDVMLVDSIKQSLKDDYLNNTKSKIIAHKKGELKKMRQRADYDDVMTLWEIKREESTPIKEKIKSKHKVNSPH